MELSKMLFYGGIAGSLGTAVITIAVILFMNVRKNRIKKILNDEYGKM